MNKRRERLAQIKNKTEEEFKHEPLSGEGEGGGVEEHKSRTV